VLLAGFEGSLRYRPGPYQYSQTQMWWFVWKMIPGLLRNRVRYGRYLDILVTHAPSQGIHDDVDLPHQGIEAFRWLVTTFRPRYHFHGHIHIYQQYTVSETAVGPTQVLNTYGYRTLNLDVPSIPKK
jgi:uncharacterized protein